MEEALGELRGHLGPQLQRHSLQARGRALGVCHMPVNTGFNEELLLTVLQPLKNLFFPLKVISCGRT